MLVACGLAWFSTRAKWFVLNPFQTQWMLLGDWEVYFNAQLLYLRSPWHLQPGALPELLHPYGMSVFYTNAIFWLSVVGKLLAPLTDREFQLFGFWYAFCFVTQGLAARMVLKEAGLGPLARVGGALLFVVDPVLMARMGHIALMTHALVLLQLWVAVRLLRSPERAPQAAWWSVALGLAAIGVEAYVAAQCLPLCIGVLAMAKRWLSWKQLAVRFAGLGVGSLVLLWVVGAIPMGHVDRTAGGFGSYSSDLLALFDPRGYSAWLPDLGSSGPQGEGFGYLGIGVLACIPLALVGLFRARRQLGRWLLHAAPLLVMIAALTVYAWSNRVTIGGRPAFELNWLFGPFGSLTDAFRTSGRFIWPLHYLVGFTIVIAAARLMTKVKWLAAVFLIGAAVQAKELRSNAEAFAPGELPPLAASWKGVGARYRHLEIVPVQLQWVCDYDTGIVSMMNRVAAQERMTINSGNVGRAPRGILERCRAPITGPVERDTIYIVGPQHRSDPLLQAAHCGTFENLWVCVSPEDKPAVFSHLAPP